MKGLSSTLIWNVCMSKEVVTVQKLHRYLCEESSSFSESGYVPARVWFLGFFFFFIQNITIKIKNIKSIQSI